MGKFFDIKLNDGDVNYLALSITNRTIVAERYRCTALLVSFYRGVVADTAKNETEQPVLGDEPNACAGTDMQIKL